ncbi:MAG: molybdopterin-dependent oxidoreductase [Clostridiales bacterium]|nr:molybdopterin-dependent oxidoreductase [Clostridiales bacterium]
MRITINGRQLDVSGKKTILEVARANGIFIPSLCDHSALVPFGGCRLCLVEIKGRKGYPPACSTYAEDGLDVTTESPALQAIRRQVLELILSEHPHACLICAEKKNCDEYKSTIRKVGEVTGCVLCPNNGRCELQDVVEALKIDRVNFPAAYRNFDVRRDDPFFDRNYNLCILCGRCVRICHEVRGVSAISFVFRGSQAVVGTVFGRPLLESGCQFCGACVDVCPTGALTERASRGEALPDEEDETICPLCSIGCGLKASLRGGRIVSFAPTNAEAVNRGQACVKGRFILRDVVYSPKRILKPLVRQNGELHEASWDEALDFVATKLKGYVGKNLGFISSTQVSLEDMHVFDRFTREVLRTDQIISFRNHSPLASFWKELRMNGQPAELNFELDSISTAKVIVLSGADIVVSHPIIWVEVFRAIKNGAKLVVINGKDSSLERHASFHLRVQAGREFSLFNHLTLKLLENNPENPYSRVNGYETWRESLLNEKKAAFARADINEAEVDLAARLLAEGQPTVFLMGPSVVNSAAASANIRALWNLAQVCGGRLIPLAGENNERGAFEIFSRSSDRVLSVEEALFKISRGEYKSLYLAGPLPVPPDAAVEFLVIQDCFMNENVQRADAVLPAATFAECGGTFVNVEGRIRKFKNIIEPLGEARPDWWIICRMAEKMGAAEFGFENAAEILSDLGRTRPFFEPACHRHQGKGKAVFILDEKKGSGQFPSGESPELAPQRAAIHSSPAASARALDYYRSLNLVEESKGLRKLRGLREK